ncbi:MAG: hypothetical protein OWQ54_08805 [Sulfolobaceae archaeon]|nr:hypothetical protein [Sulfolobaceae archaeon]
MSLNKTIAILLVIFIVSGVIVGYGIGYFLTYSSLKNMYQIEINSIKSNYERSLSNISAQLDQINSTLKSIMAGYNALMKAYTELNSSYNLLEQKYSLLNSDYMKLYENYTALLTRYDGLLEEYSNITKIITNNVSEYLLVENITIPPNGSEPLLENHFLRYSGYLNIDILLAFYPINVTIILNNSKIGLYMVISKVISTPLKSNLDIIIPVTTSNVTIIVKNLNVLTKNQVYIIVSYRF